MTQALATFKPVVERKFEIDWSLGCRTFTL